MTKQFTGSLKRRVRINSLYSQESEMPDASRLAYLGGPIVRWTEKNVAEMWANARSKTPNGGSIESHLYVHVPFCKSICQFCNYERLRPSNTEELEKYLDRVLYSIHTLAPSVRHLHFSSLYFGGGTPSVLPAKLLKRLLEVIDQNFSFTADNGRTFEFDPAVMNAEKLKITREHGFHRFSFGVQTLDDKAMANHNRGPQSREMIAARFKDMRSSGVDDIAVDILLGLAGTEPDQLLEEIDEMMGVHRPERIHIFMVTPTHEYIDSHFNGDFESFWKHIAGFEKLIPPSLNKMAKRHDYVYNGGQGHIMRLKRKGRFTKFNRATYTQLSCLSGTPINLFGLGPSARSSIFGKANFQCQRPESGRGPFRYQGHVVSMADEARSFLVHLLRDQDQIDLERFEDILGQDINALHPQALHAWREHGIADQAKGKLHFMPQPRRDRTDSLLWLVPEEHLEHEIARRWQLQLDVPGLMKWLSPIVTGKEIYGGILLQGLEDAHILLKTTDDKTLRCRVAPGWKPRSVPRLILLDMPAQAERTTIKKVLSVIGKTMQNNKMKVLP